jgi:hypothetical protein
MFIIILPWWIDEDVYNKQYTTNTNHHKRTQYTVHIRRIRKASTRAHGTAVA